jgi:hypothetical protein
MPIDEPNVTDVTDVTAVDKDDPLQKFLANPPDWFVNQVTQVAYGAGDNLLKATASSVAFSVFNDPRRADEVRSEIERWIETKQKEGEA